MSGDAWQHLHTIGCFATALSLIQSPSSPSPSLPPNSPSLKHFQIHLQLLPTLPPPRKYASKNFLSWGFKERGGNAIVAIFYFASSCKWSKVHHNTKLLTTYQHQNVNERHISPLSDFEEYFWALSSLGKRAQT